MDVLAKESHSTDLLVYLYRLYHEKSLCDVVIHTFDGGLFHAHRVVLTASSEYLHKIFRNGPSLSTITLDISSAVLQVLLEFSYTGQLFVSQQLHGHLQQAARFLQMYNVLDLLKTHTDAKFDSLNGDATVSVTCTEVKTEGPPAETEPSQHDNASNYDELSDDGTIDFLDDIQLDSIADEEESQSKNLKDKKTRTKKESQSENGDNTKDEAAQITPARRRGRVSKVATRAKSSKVTTRAKRGKKSEESVTTQQKDGAGKRKRKSDSVLSINGTEVKKKVKKSSGRRSVSKSRKKVKVERKSRVHKKAVNNIGEIQYIMKRKSSRRALTIDRRKTVWRPLNNLCHCAECDIEFPAFALKRRHMLKCHPQNNVAILTGQCLLEQAKGYIYTSQDVKLSDRNINCRVCGKQFSKRSLFTLHFTRCHSKVLKRNSHLMQFVSKKCRRNPFVKVSTFAASSKRKGRKIKTEKRSYSASLKKAKVKEESVKETKPRRLPKAAGIRTPKKTRISKAERMGNTFECCYCKRKLISQYALFKHLRFVHQNTTDEARQRQYDMHDSMACEVRTCTFTTKNLGDMQSHVHIQHPFINHNCSHCKAEFQVPLLLRRHSASAHEKTNRKRYECSLCSAAFLKTQGLRRHEFWKHEIHHPSVKVFQCDYPGCTYKTSASSSIKTHQNKHIKEKRFTCEHCGMKLKTEVAVAIYNQSQYHQNKHIKEKRFTCEHCGMKLKTEVSHKKHINKMHLGIRPYLCQICGASFGEDHELKSHFVCRHSTERNYQCEYCPYATAVKGTFFTHLFNVHKVKAEDDKRKVYKCTQCPFISVLRHRYRTHLNGHLGRREYVCKVCNKGFISPGTLRTHVQWLHSDKVFSCTQCDYQTKTTQKLSEHIRVQHQLKGYFPYRCPYCDFRCATGGNTRKHVKQVHKNAEVRYLRDEQMLTAARIARASGHFSSLVEMAGPEMVDHQGSSIPTSTCQPTAEDNILQIMC